MLEGTTSELKGRVRLPEGTPADERVLVLALSTRRGSRGIYGGSGPAYEAWHDGKDDELIAFTEMERDATFTLQVPEDVESVHLALAGRYVYSLETREVSLPPLEAPLLGGQLGARVTGRILPPPGLTAADLELEDEVIALGPDITANFDPTVVQDIGYEIRTKVDAEGNYELRGVPCDITHGFFFRHDQVAMSVELGLETAPGQHRQADLQLVHGVTLEGRVADEAGGPIEGAKVATRYPGPLGRGMGSLKKTETDAEGRFTLPNVMPGRVELRVSKDGFVPYGERLAEEVVDGQTFEVAQITLSKGGVVTGRVTFPDGEPAPDVFVRASIDLVALGGLAMAGGAVDTSHGASGTTDADGRFELSGLKESVFVVRASLSGEDDTWQAKVDGVRPGGDPLRLELERLLTLSGRVEDTEGNPIPAFRITAKQTGSGGMFGIGAETSDASFEDEEGKFELERLSAGDWEVLALADGLARSETKVVTLPTVDELVFQLQPAASVAGVVLDTADQPVAGAKVQLELDLNAMVEMQRTGTAPEARTDAEGRFLLEGLDPGAASVLATHQGFASSSPEPVEVFAGETTEDVVLRLRTGGTLIGTVLNSEGEPWAGRMITVQSMPDFSRRRIDTSDGDGAFRVEHLEPGQWQVIAAGNMMTGELDGSTEGGMNDFLEGMEFAMVDILDGEETEVVLGKPAEDPVLVRGRVTHDGQAVENSMISFVPESGASMGQLKMAMTDAQGGYEVELEERGGYLVTVQKVEDMGQQVSVEFQENVPDEVAEVSADFELPLGRITGTVTGPDGDPVKNCRVTLGVDGGLKYGSFMGGHYAESATDDQGRYELEYLRPGRYSVSVGGVMLGGMLGDAGSYGRKVRSDLRVDEGDTLAGIDFELERPGSLSGLVRTSDGSGVAEASVFLRDENGQLLERISFVTTDASGKFDYSGISPGSYTVMARVSDQVSAPSSVIRVRSGERSEANVTIDPGTYLLVTVIDRSDKEVGARVSVTDDQGNEVTGMFAMTELMDLFQRGFANKQQRVGPLPPGSYKVRAVLDDGRSATKSVTLSGQPERSLKIRVR